MHFTNVNIYIERPNIVRPNEPNGDQQPPFVLYGYNEEGTFNLVFDLHNVKTIFQ